jgi:tetratricopeptide (TPR) repeat protein
MFAPAVIAPLLAALAAFAVALCPAWDYDAWFQLACGRAITLLHALPATDLFSFTAAGSPWDTQEWLSQVIFFFIQDRGGFSALTTAKALATALLFFLLARHAIRRGANPWLALALSAWGSFILRWFTVERPAMFSMLFLAVQLSALSRGRAPWWLVPLTALWANLHGGSSLLGPGVTGAWIAGAAATALWNRHPLAGLKWSALVLAGQVLAIFINPAGWHLLLYPFETTSDLMYMENVKEWLPPTLSEFPGFFGFLAVAVAVLILSIRSWAVSDMLFMAAFGWLALTARRHIPLFVIAVLPPLAAGATLILRGLPARARRAAPPLAILLALSLVGALAWDGSALRTGIRGNLYPDAGISFLRDNAPAMAGGGEIRLFTLHKWGGYAEWLLPERFKVFIDGRQMVFGTGLFTDYYRILEDMPEANDLLDDWKPDAFLLEYGSKLGARFARTREAALVRWDDTCLLYLARTGKNAALIRGHEYRAFNPEGGSWGGPAATEADIRRAIRENPGQGRPWNCLAAFYLSRGKNREAWEASSGALKAAPDAVPALLTAADAAMALGNFNDAHRLVRRAVSVDSGACAPRLYLARLALAGDNPRRALDLADRAVAVGLRRRAQRHQPEPALVDAYILQSNLLENSGDSPRSIDSLRKAGNTAFELGNQPLAMEIYRRGISRAPRDARFYHNIGVVLSSGGRNAEAVIYLRKALELDGRNSDTMAALGVAYYRLKLLPLAREMWKKAVETTPNHPEAALYLKQSEEKPVPRP